MKSAVFMIAVFGFVCADISFAEAGGRKGSPWVKNERAAEQVSYRPGGCIKEPRSKLEIARFTEWWSQRIKKRA